jgi:hypothetical protein
MKKALPSTLWNNLISYYSGDNTPNDSKGTINGTLVNGATYGTGKINNGFSFDGINDRVTMGNNFNFDGSTPFTFSFWMNLTVLTDQTILGKWNNTNVGYLFFLISGKLRIALSNNVSTNILRVDTVNSLTTGLKLITITYDGSKSSSGLKIKIDNSNQSLTILNNSLTSNFTTTDDFILGWSSTGLPYYKGIIDELAIWDRVLTDTEVTELYNSGSGKQYPL